MSSSSGMVSNGRAQMARGDEFERKVRESLAIFFGSIESHQRVEGFSGVKWRVDFVADKTVIVEASVQRRLETKIDSTFLKFIDITRKHPEMRAVLVLTGLQAGLHKSVGKKYFPTSGYRTMIRFGFPIITPPELPRMLDFVKGAASAFDISARPSGIHARSVFSSTRETGERILTILAKGPATRKELSEALGVSRTHVDDALRSLPQLRKVSSYHGFSDDQIFRRLVKKKNRSSSQAKAIRAWLGDRILEALMENRYRNTKAFSSEYGLPQQSLAIVLHQLCEDGLIRHEAKGRWSLVRHDLQTKLNPS